MKKYIAIFTLAVSLFTGCHLYSLRAEVVNVFDGAVAVEDTDGEVWLFDDEGTLAVGDSVLMVMDDKGTRSIRDDEIVTIRQVAQCNLSRLTG